MAGWEINLYISYQTRYIAYAVSVVSQFMHQPQIDHMEAAVRIVRYLKGTFDHGIMFKKNDHLEIHGYTQSTKDLLLDTLRLSVGIWYRGKARNKS